jgi:hypothetical protein
MDNLFRRHRMGFRTSPSAKILINILILLIYGTLFPNSGVAAQESQPRERSVRGETVTVRVPMVAERWDATLSSVHPKPQKRIWLGRSYPGYREFKSRANARRQALEGSPRSSRASADYAPAQARPLSSASPAQQGQGTVFDGPDQQDASFIPPDSQIAAGPDYLAVAINSVLDIYDKSGNLVGVQEFDTFFDGLGVTGSIYSPRLIYDQADGRYILSVNEVDLGGLSNANVFLAVSASSDPTGTWYKFAINSMGRNAANTTNTYPDSPGLGLSQSAVYITTNQFELNQTCLNTGTQPCYFSDAQIKVIGLPALLSGNSSLSITAFTNIQTVDGFPAVAIQPAVTYGSSSNEFMAAARFDAYAGTEFNLFAIPVSGVPTLSTADLTVPSYAYPSDATQEGTASTILTGDFRPLNAVWANGSLYFAQNVSASNSTVAAQWYEIQISDLSSASLAQSGDVSGDGDAYFPAISPMANGTVGLAFTTSSSFEFASAAFTAREAADSPGTMRSYSVYRAGTAPYDEAANALWGDYSGISEDPDGSSLWMIAEFAETPDVMFGTGVAQILSPPALSASPLSLTFTNTAPNAVLVPEVVSVSNIGSGTVNIQALVVGGTNAADFALSSDTCSATMLPAGQSCTATVTFNPSHWSTWEQAVLTVPYGTGNLARVGVEGFAVTKPVLTFMPSPLIFPPTLMQAASAPLTATLTNIGNASSPLTDLQVGGDFTQTNNCGSSLAAGASCTFSVIFRPTGSGLEQGSISYSGSYYDPAIIEPINGVAIVAPAALFCPPSVSFSNQAMHSASAPQPVMLTNNGSATLNIVKVAATGDFAETDDCVGSLPARSSCVINVTFQPAAVGSRTGGLMVSDDAPGSPQSMTLTGVGTTSASGSLVIPAQVAAALWQTTSFESAVARIPPAPDRPPVAPTPARQALYFEPNLGQFGTDVEFLSRAGEGRLALNRTGLELQLARRSGGKLPPQAPHARGYASRVSSQAQSGLSSVNDSALIKMTLLGANPAARASGTDELPGKSNYFLGSDPSRWHSSVPTYARVKTEGVYPGIDLVYYGNESRLEYDFVVSPHAQPSSIALKFEGQTTLRIDSKSGDLVLETQAGDLRIHKPLAYQLSPSGATPATHRLPVRDAQFRLVGDRVTFKVGHYDKTKPLIIDPVISFSTYLAGSVQDTGNAITMDSAGNIYVAGSTASPDFPVTSGAFQTTSRLTIPQPGYGIAPLAFVTKLSPDGSLVYSTFLGGSATAVAQAIAVDSASNAYLTGYTLGQGFPVTPGAVQGSCPGANDTYTTCRGGFVTKLNASGSALVYSTYLGGDPTSTNSSSQDQGLGIGVDAAGDAFVGGSAVSSNFPTTPGAFQTTAVPIPPDSILLDKNHGFLTELNPTGTAFVFSTYIGGTSSDQVNGVAVDNSGNVYVAGQTTSIDFPTTSGAFQPGPFGHDAFVAKFNHSGAVVYSTYFGGTGTYNYYTNYTRATAIAVDSTGAAYFTGNPGNGIAVTPNAYQTATSESGASGYLFAAKLHPAGCSLLYSTYVGSSVQAFGSWSPGAITLDASNHLYLAGGASLFNVAPAPPQVNGLEPPIADYEGNTFPGFVAELDPTLSHLLFSSFLGGTGDSGVAGIAVDSAGDMYVAGTTTARDFPVANAFEAIIPGSQGAFVTKISPQPANAVLLTRNSLTFGSEPVGIENLQMLAVGLMNQLSTPLNISSVSVTGSGFSLVTNDYSNPFPCTGTIASGIGCIVQVQYAPTAVGAQTGTLTITDNGPGSPRNIALNGTGQPDFGMSVSSSSATVMRGSDSAQFTISLSAPSGSPVESVALSCTGLAAATCNFNPPAMYVNGGTGTLTVSGLSSFSGNSLSFSVVATALSQTISQSLSILIQDFTLAASQTSLSVTPGQTAAYSVTVTPQAGFNYSLFFSCSGAPALATCAVNPDPMSLDGTQPATVQVNVTTTAASATYRVEPRLLPPPGLRAWHELAGLALLVLLSVALAVAGAKPRRAWLGLALILLIGGSWICCGGGSGGGGGGGGGGSSPGTAAGTYSIVVTGTYNAGSTPLSHSLTLTLKVQ